MDFLKDMLQEQGAGLVGGLVDKLGFSTEQAEAFVPAAAESVVDVVKETGGDLDLSDLASNAGKLVNQVDVAGLAQKVGIDASQAGSGLVAIVPTMLAALQEKAGGLSGLTSMLGGEGLGKTLGDVGGLAGKLFNK